MCAGLEQSVAASGEGREPQGALSALLREHTLLRQLYEGARVGYALNALDGRFLEFNESFRALTGYDRERLLTLDLAALTPPEFVDEDRRQLQRLLREGHYGPYEREFIRADGSRIDVQLNGLLVTADDGHRYVWSIAEDIVERRRVAAALAVGEARLRSVFESMVEGVVIQARDGSIVDFNPAAAVILGLRRDEVIGRTSVDPRWRATREDGSPWPGDEHPAMVSLRTGAPVRGAIMRIATSAGGERWISISSQPIFSSGGRTPDLAVATFVDVTETRRLIRELGVARADLQAILDHVPGRVGACDANLAFRFLNRAAERHYGVEPGAAVGRPVREVIGEANFRELEAIIPSLLRGQPQTVELTETRPDGSVRNMHFHAVPLYGPEGITGLMSLATDVTELRDAHRRLRELAQRIEDIREDERRATATALHEGIAQDLFAARMKLHGLEREAGGAPGIVESCRGIAAILEHSIRATRGVAMGLRPTMLAATGFLPALEDHIDYVCRLTGLAIELDVVDDFPRMDEDTSLMFFRAAQEALTNVALHAGATQVAVRLSCGDGHVRMEIADDGVGFVLEAVDKSGGLGLFAVRERFKSKGGYCDVQSAPGKGTTVAVGMPRRAD